eukprot:augustus_masked-scaffold_1-processed-gene-4.7-mRNA-1 protein AED:1.00 eAED:1.00 QI:0/0/0/0/1/1/2/0/533
MFIGNVALTSMLSKNVKKEEYGLLTGTLSSVIGLSSIAGPLLFTQLYSTLGLGVQGSERGFYFKVLGKREETLEAHNIQLPETEKFDPQGMFLLCTEDGYFFGRKLKLIEEPVTLGGDVIVKHKGICEIGTVLYRNLDGSFCVRLKEKISVSKEEYIDCIHLKQRKKRRKIKNLKLQYMKKIVAHVNRNSRDRVIEISEKDKLQENVVQKGAARKEIRKNESITYSEHDESMQASRKLTVFWKTLRKTSLSQCSKKVIRQRKQVILSTDRLYCFTCVAESVTKGEMSLILPDVKCDILIYMLESDQVRVSEKLSQHFENEYKELAHWSYEGTIIIVFMKNFLTDWVQVESKERGKESAQYNTFEVNLSSGEFLMSLLFISFHPMEKLRQNIILLNSLLKNYNEQNISTNHRIVSGFFRLPIYTTKPGLLNQLNELNLSKATERDATKLLTTYGANEPEVFFLPTAKFTVCPGRKATSRKYSGKPSYPNKVLLTKELRCERYNSIVLPNSETDPVVAVLSMNKNELDESSCVAM